MSLTAKILLSPVLVAQGVWTRRVTPRLPEAEGPRAGAVGSGPRLGLLLVGDSSAAGVGASTQSQALAGQVVETLAKRLHALRAGRRIEWRLEAQSGLTTAQALELLYASQAFEADVALVFTGVNDVVEQVPTHRAVQARRRLADWLCSRHGVRHVAFAALPPMGQFKALPQPLRWVAGRDARRHDEALARWTQGRSDVSHVRVQVPFTASALASDGFHPGPLAYQAYGEAVSDHLLREGRIPH